jgi:soluble lytic murein transglycosylase-like protein
MKRIKGRKMRHDVLQIIAMVMAIISMNAASSSPYLFNYDLLGTKNQTYPLPAGYLKPHLLETSPVVSQHLAIYEQQDSERLQKQDPKSHGFNNPSKSDSPTDPRHEYSYRIAKTVPNHQFVEDIFIVSQEYNIDPLLLHAIAEVESAFNANAISKAGAQGLMQVMPDTARRFGMQNPKQELFNPISNLRVSSNYIRSLYELFGNNIPLILAAYNAGENAVIKYGYKIPPYRETKNYVEKVMKRYLELKDKSYRL